MEIYNLNKIAAEFKLVLFFLVQSSKYNSFSPRDVPEQCSRGANHQNSLIISKNQTQSKALCIIGNIY